jgi:CRP/FNR family transcriptional regulator
MKKNSSISFEENTNPESVFSRNERHFKSGTLMFVEGESSHEMFIIRSGKVRILKQEGQFSQELAELGPGSVIGELCLLDHQQRDATAQVIEDTVVTVIDKELFSRTMNKVPFWLSAVIKQLVKRLRDTTQKTSTQIINRNISGFIRILTVLDSNEGVDIGESRGVLLSRLKETVFSITGLGSLQVELLLLHLILKEMVLIHRSNGSQEYVILKSPEILHLYMNFLKARQCGRKLIGEDFPENAFQLLTVIQDAGERCGIKESDSLVRITQQQVENELERSGRDKSIDRDALGVLENSRLILIRAEHEKEKCTVFIYNRDILRRVSLLRTWLPLFKEEISV